MIRKIQIENFKSIKKMKLDLGRVNVFIGENGSGKSNILEAIALAGAAAANKLDNEFLASRGIRAAEPRLMRCALRGENSVSDITISIGASDGRRADLRLSHDGKPYSSWKRDETGVPFVRGDTLQMIQSLDSVFSKLHRESDASGHIPSPVELEEIAASLQKISEDVVGVKSIADSLTRFVIFSPENNSLRVFQREGQIEPLGIQGEGLLKFLRVLSDTPEHEKTLSAIRNRLSVLDWFDDLRIPDDKVAIERSIEIADKYLGEEAGELDQVSANEGFLFLLFYFCLFSSELTPRFFAIDNVDASLNPKLCAHLVCELVKLAKDNDKQAILTTHNPATLDGLNLNDDEQRLFVISRGDEGETKIRRIKQKEGSASDVKLSTAFINGYLGGLPKNF